MKGKLVSVWLLAFEKACGYWPLAFTISLVVKTLQFIAVTLVSINFLFFRI
jgi:hypothetical protein